MNKIPKILIVPARRHILEAYYEYIIRYLSDEFIIHQAYAPYPPYEEFAKDPHANGNNPLMKNPDDYDLLLPHFTTHWNYYGDEHWSKDWKSYGFKTALVYLESHNFKKTAICASTSRDTKAFLADNSHHDLRFGVDTELFKPFPIEREDNLLHVGFVGNWLTPRRYLKDLFMPLKDLEGIRLMIYPTDWASHYRPDEIESVGGTEFVKSIAGGDVWYPGLPNIYNQMDVFIRCDIDHGYQLSVMEAAACGVPVVCVNSGPTVELTEAGGGIGIDNGEGKYKSLWEQDNLDRIAKEIRKAVIFLRDNPIERREIGRKGRHFIETFWRWENFIDKWRVFFQEGLTNAKKV